MLKKFLLVMAAGVFVSTAGAQAVDAAKDAGQAVAQGTKEAGRNAKAAVESGSAKAADKSRAHMHKAKARYHRHKAKVEADAAIH